MTKNETPGGPTQVKWFGNGYQAALRDIAAALEQGGESAARVWVANNMQGDPTYVDTADFQRNYVIPV